MQQPRRRGRVCRERTHRVRQHLELPTDRHLLRAFAQDPRPPVPQRLGIPGSFGSIFFFLALCGKKKKSW